MSELTGEGPYQQPLFYKKGDILQITQPMERVTGHRCGWYRATGDEPAALEPISEPTAKAELREQAMLRNAGHLCMVEIYKGRRAGGGK